MTSYTGWTTKLYPNSKQTKKVRQSFTDFVKEHFQLTCKKCGSTNVVINYEQEGGYSEYTNWGSSFSMGCNDCGENDIDA